MNGDREECARRCLIPRATREGGVVEKTFAGWGSLLCERDLAVRVRRFRDVVVAHAVERMPDLYRLPTCGDGHPFAAAGSTRRVGGADDGLVDDGVSAERLDDGIQELGVSSLSCSATAPTNTQVVSFVGWGVLDRLQYVKASVDTHVRFSSKDTSRP